MQKGATKIRNKTPKTYSRPSSREQREYRVPMTFMVSVSIKLKIQTCPYVIEKKKKNKKNRTFQYTQTTYRNKLQKTYI